MSKKLIKNENFLSYRCLLLIMIVFIYSCVNRNNSESKSVSECLVGYDWCQPSCSNASMAWKFSSDNTFNYSTTLFGGMSAWGTWSEIGNNQIELTYTKTTTGDIIPKKLLSMPNCNSLKIGSTIYRR